MSFLLCLHQAHPLPSLSLVCTCLYLVLCVVFLSDFSSFFSLLSSLPLVPCLTWSLLPGSSPGPFCLACFSYLVSALCLLSWSPSAYPASAWSLSLWAILPSLFWSKVRIFEEWRKSGQARKMGESNGVCLCLFLPLPPSQYIFIIHRHDILSFYILDWPELKEMCLKGPEAPTFRQLVTWYL